MFLITGILRAGGWEFLTLKTGIPSGPDYLLLLPGPSCPSTAECRPTKMPTKGGHDLTFQRVPSRADSGLLHHMWPMCGWPLATHGPWLRSAKMALLQSREWISTTDYNMDVKIVFVKFDYRNQKFEFFDYRFWCTTYQTLNAVSVKGLPKLHIPEPVMLKDNFVLSLQWWRCD